MTSKNSRSDFFLICRSHPRLCALPLASVGETMRSLPIQIIPDMPGYILGASIIRGAIVPVVDVANLLGVSGHSHRDRLVTLRFGERCVAFAVDEVIGVRKLDGETTQTIPPLLTAIEAGIIESMTMLDAELLLVLQAAHLIPDAVWNALDSKGMVQ